MPSRLLSLGIVLFWLVVNGWLFWYDLLPRLLPEQTPPFTIEVVEEAKPISAYVSWKIYEGDLSEGNPIAFAKTRIEHPQNDVFELVAEIAPRNKNQPIEYGRLLIDRINSVYRVTAAGDLLGLSSRIDAKLANQDAAFTLEGVVESDQLTPRWQMLVAGKRLLNRDLATVQAPRGGAVLLPIHPVNRMRELGLGQSWNVHLVDAIAGDMNFARASVRLEEELFTHGKYRDLACLVIDYDSDDVKVSAWVARKTGLVMCQKTTRGKPHWALYRE